MEIKLAQLDSLAERLTAMHASDAVQALDQEDRRTITQAAQTIEAIAHKVRKARKERQDLHDALVKIIVDALMADCPPPRKETEETAATAGG